MDEDVETRVFTLIVSMEDPTKKGNQGDLQNLFDEGWTPDFISDKMQMKNGDYCMVWTLERSKFKDSK